VQNFSYYIKIFFFPIQLIIDQQWVIKKINFTDFYLPLIADILFFVIISLLGLYVYKTSKKSIKIYIFYLSWFIVGLSLYLQIFPIDGIVADRWFYFPIVGILGLFGTAIYQIGGKYNLSKFVPVLLCIIILLFLSVRTIIRNTDWSSYILLFSHDSKNYDNYDIENNLGTAYDLSGNYSQALIHFQSSANLYPSEISLHDIGNEYRNLGDYNKAEVYYYKALNSQNSQKDYKHPLSAYTDLVFILLLNNEFKEAKEFITTKALANYSNSSLLWIELAICDYELRNQNSAINEAEKAKELAPMDLTVIDMYNHIVNRQPIQIKNSK